MKEIARGAEAVIYQDKYKDNKEGDKEVIVKHRPEKGYRLRELDQSLRKQRTRREARLLQKAKIPRPGLIKTDQKEKIIMQKIKGHKLRDVLDQKPGLAQKTGEIVAELHNQDIIHGDLTTSNLILSPENKLFLIDFGLSFHSQKIEDKAVDIHLFKQALESKHHKVYDQALKLFMKGYKKSNNYEQIIARLEKVEARGRYKK